MNDGGHIPWQPGMPVVTEQDRADWQDWRRERILHPQRERRRSLRRIDIDGIRINRPGGDASSIIDRIIGEWVADRSGIK